MHNALSQFQENLKRARELGALAASVERITTSAIDVSDMWRAQIVLGVSALDHFVHEIARIGMIEIAKGLRPKTDAYSRFALPIKAIDHALTGQSPENWLGDAVRDKHSWLSFQHPDKIADAIRLISPVKLWEYVGNELGIPAADVKVRLELVVDRRNKIAHEADMDPTSTGFRWPISPTIAVDAVTFIDEVGHAIFKVAV
jgi:hypothetical protein